MDIKELEKHGYVGKECRAFSFDIANHRFMCIKENEKEWRLRSYEEMQIPDIILQMPKENMSLSQIADTAMYCLFEYLDKRQGLIQDLMQSIKENLKG